MKTMQKGWQDETDDPCDPMAGLASEPCDSVPLSGYSEWLDAVRRGRSSCAGDASAATSGDFSRLDIP